MSETFLLLLQKLDRFIRRYYLNRLIKGALLFGSGFLVLFILFAGIEYFGYLDSTIRQLLFYSFLLFNGYVFVRYVLIPFFGIIRIGRRISPDQAAGLLSKYYPDKLNDQVTNVLQLKQYLDKNPENTALIMAAIDQKAKRVNVVPFHKAIPLKGNLRFVPYVLLPLLVVLGVYLMQPSVLFEPTKRILRYDTEFERPTPFVVDVVSSTEGFRHEDLEVVIQTRGEVVPSETFFRMDEVRHSMANPSSGKYAYTVRNLQEDKLFFIEAEGFTFGPFPINVYEKPAFTHFHIEADYPSYSGMQTEDFTNMGDLEVLYGSQIRWNFFTRATDQVSFFMEDQALDVEKIRDGEFAVQTQATESFDYTVFSVSEDRGKGDSLSYRVQVEEDAYPRIAVEEHRDDVMIAHLFYQGNIRDDFGFTGLRFFYRVMDQSQVNRGEEVPFMDEAVEIDPYMRNQNFHYHFDMQSVDVEPGETVELYFEAYDNDPYQGPKSARSRVFSHYIPTEEEMIAEQQESEQQIQEGLREGKGQAGEARDQVEELRRQLLDSEKVGWEQREMLQELVDKQQQMEERIREMAEEKQEQEARSEQFMESDDELKEKQEELQELFDETLSDEMKALFEELQQEMDQLSRDEIYEKLDQMDFEFQDMERSMERNIEMFRQFAMERMLQESIDRLENLQEAQEDLREQTIGEEKQDSLDQQQEELNQAYDEVRDKLEEFQEANQGLSRPHTLDDTGQIEEEVAESLQEALEGLQENDLSGAGQSQQDARGKMNKLSGALQRMQQRIFEEQLAEDAQAIRMLLENLLKSSFDQETLINETKQANVNDPLFVEMIRDQRKIQRNMEMIEDSLVALAQRQMAIRSYVNREVAEVQHQMEEGIDHMINRRQHQAASRQQLVMTHINNLALMLNESLQEVQQQMANSEGTGDGSEGESGSPSFQNMRQMQEQMNQMLQDAREGQQPMPGETGEQMSMSEQMARMAARQEAIRNELRRKEQEMRNQGQEVNEELQELQRQMEQSELDMLRKELSSQTMERQQEILTRLLEHERAERQQEQEDRREGTTANDYELSNPEEIFQYNRDREREVEMLRSLPPRLRSFFRQKVEMYFLHVD